MKALLKIKILIPIISIIFSIFPFAVIAEECVTDPASGKLVYCPLEGEAFKGFDKAGGTAGDLGDFLSQAFEFGLAIAAALAVIMIVWGGVEIMLSESMFKKEDGRKKIQDAIWGLVLALVSWLILYTINPQILNWSFLKNTPVTSNVNTAPITTPTYGPAGTPTGNPNLSDNQGGYNAPQG